MDMQAYRSAPRWPLVSACCRECPSRDSKASDRLVHHSLTACHRIREWLQAEGSAQSLSPTMYPTTVRTISYPAAVRTGSGQD